MKKLILSIVIVLTLNSCTNTVTEEATNVGFMKGIININNFGAYGTRINGGHEVTNIVTTVSEKQDKIIIYDTELINVVGSNEITTGNVYKFSETSFRIYNFNGTEKSIYFGSLGAGYYTITVDKNNSTIELFRRSAIFKQFYNYE
jgi:hypothetical protein